MNFGLNLPNYNRDRGEPFTSSLDDFREQIRLFAREVAPRYIHR